MSKKTIGFVAVARIDANVARHLNGLNYKLNALYDVNRTAAESLIGDMVERDHECWFSASHTAKDLGIAARMAREVKLKVAVNETAKAQYDLMTTEGLGELDKSGVAEMTFPGRHAHPKKKRTT